MQQRTHDNQLKMQSLKSFFLLGASGFVLFSLCKAFDAYAVSVLWPVSPLTAYLRTIVLMYFTIYVSIKAYSHFWGNKKIEEQTWKDLESIFKKNFPENWEEEMAEYRQEILANRRLRE